VHVENRDVVLYTAAQILNDLLMVSGFCESSKQRGSVVDCIICVICIIYCVQQLGGDARTLFFDVHWRRSSKFWRILTSGVRIIRWFFGRNIRRYVH